MKCLTNNKLKDYLKGNLTIDEMMAIGDHIENCPACKEKLQRLCAYPLTQKLLDTDDCPEYEDIALFVEDKLTDKAKTSHILSCSTCNRDAEKIRALRAAAALRDEITVVPQFEKRRSLSWKRFVWMPIAAVLAGFIIYPMTTKPIEKTGTPVATTQVSKEYKPAKQISDKSAKTNITEKQQTVASAPKTLEKNVKTSSPKPIVNKKTVATKKTETKQENKPVLIAMNNESKTIVMRNEADKDAKTELTTNNNKISWETNAMATEYIIRIYNEDGTLVEEAIVNETSYTPTKLEAGKTYLCHTGFRANSTEEWQISQSKTITIE